MHYGAGCGWRAVAAVLWAVMQLLFAAIAAPLWLSLQAVEDDGEEILDGRGKSTCNCTRCASVSCGALQRQARRVRKGLLPNPSRMPALWPRYSALTSSARPVSPIEPALADYLCRCSMRCSPVLLILNICQTLCTPASLPLTIATAFSRPLTRQPPARTCRLFLSPRPLIYDDSPPATKTCPRSLLARLSVLYLQPALCRRGKNSAICSAVRLLARAIIASAAFHQHSLLISH